MSLINFVKDNYSRLPPWLLRFGGTAYYLLPRRLRYGKDFCDTTRLLQQTEFMSRDELDALVNERFLHTVRNAYENVPFYRRRFDEHGVQMDLIRDISDITRLPTMTKSDIRAAGHDLLSRKVDPAGLLLVKTSGTSGEPIDLYQPQSMTMTEWAYTLHIWSRLGYRPESSRLVLRAKRHHPGAGDPDIFYDHLRRELVCNIFNMSPGNMERYCLAIERYRPEYIHCYMSSIMAFAHFVHSRPGGLKHRFKGIFPVSECVLPRQRQFLEETFACPVLPFYGHSERQLIAGECEHSTDYHIEPLYGYGEILTPGGDPTRQGELVVTGFLNDAMPLIRYRTGDMAAWSDRESCPCGRAHTRIGALTGRAGTDVLVDCDGIVISPHMINRYGELDGIQRYKFIQHVPGEVTLRMVPGPAFHRDALRSIDELLKTKLQGRIRFRVELVDDLPLLPNGKFRMVEQHIPIDEQVMK